MDLVMTTPALWTYARTVWVACQDTLAARPGPLRAGNPRSGLGPAATRHRLLHRRTTGPGGRDRRLGSRSKAKADTAADAIRARVPGADIRHLPLDLGDLTSLKSSVDGLDELDAVVLNAGIALDSPGREPWTP